MIKAAAMQKDCNLAEKYFRDAVESTYQVIKSSDIVDISIHR